MGNMLIISTEWDEYDHSSMFDVFTSTVEYWAEGEKGHSSAKKRPSETINQAEGRKEAAERLEMQHKLSGNIWPEKWWCDLNQNGIHSF